MVSVRRSKPLQYWANKRGAGQVGIHLDLPIFLIFGVIGLAILSPPGRQAIVAGVTNAITPNVIGTGDGFEDSLAQTLKWEGTDCSNDAGDAGGLTCKGITNAEYKAHGGKGSSVQEMTDDEMKTIYKGYWDRCQAGSKPMPLGFALFDTCVNFDEEAVKKAGWFDNLPDNPIEACKTIMDRRIAYRHERANESVDGVSQSKFLDGWLNRDNDAKAFCEKYTVPGTVDSNRSGPFGDAPLNQGPLKIQQMDDKHSRSVQAVPVQSSGIDPRAAMVVINTPRSLGSGVVVSDDGLILTAHHVVECRLEKMNPGGCPMTVTLANGQRVTAQAVKLDQGRDLALLKVNAGTLLSLPLATADPTNGESLTGYGFGNATYPINTGTVTSNRGNGGRGAMRVSTAFYPGNSGGGIVNQQNQVAGIIQGAEGNAAPISTITQFLNQP